MTPTQEDRQLALPPLQDALTRIFDDAGGSDMLVDLLAAFDFESSRELAEVITVGIAGHEAKDARIAALEAEVQRLREAEATAIANWLVIDAVKTSDDLRRLHAKKALTPQQTAEWKMLISLKSGLAAAIKAGEHRRATLQEKPND